MLSSRISPSAVTLPGCRTRGLHLNVQHSRPSCRSPRRLAGFSGSGVLQAYMPVQSAQHPISPDPQHLTLLPAFVANVHPTVATLVYFSGTDGTGQAITPQLPGLAAAGFDVRCLYIPVADRSSWQALMTSAVRLLEDMIASSPHTQVTLVGESFGGCLALRVASEAPHLIARLALVNPATCFNASLGGLSSLVAATNLLSIFPKPLYETAQAVLVPLLVDRERVAPVTTQAVQAMMLMSAPASFQEISSTGQDSSTTQQLAAEAAGGWYVPSATASWRLNLLRSGNLPDAQLAGITVPTLVIASACDRLLPSLGEATRLVALLPHARRVTLPNSGHTALLEEGVDLAVLMDRAGFLPPGVKASPRNLKTQLTTGAPYSNNSSTNSISTVSDNFSTPGCSAVASGAVAVPTVGNMGDVSPAAVAAASVADFSVASTASLDGAGIPAQAAVQDSRVSRIRTKKRAPSLATTEQTQPPWQLLADISAQSADAQYGSFSAASLSSTGVDFASNDPNLSGTPSPAAALPPTFVSDSEECQPRSLDTASFTAASAAHAPDTLGSLSPVAALPPTSHSDSDVRQPGSSNCQSGSNGSHVKHSTSGRSESSPPLQANAPSDSTAAPDTAPAWALPNANIERAMGQLAGWRALVSPRVFGSANLPDPLRAPQQPLLFVGNHTRFGLFDLPPLIMELYSRGITVRGLADPRHWLGPVGQVFESFGAVKAGAFTAARLLRERQAMLLFPGGGREVMKRRGEEYQLFWRRDRTDFVRLAAKYNAIIVPFSAVGADDAYNLFMDTDEVLANPITGPLARSAVAALDDSLDPADTVMPVATLPGTPIPSLLPLPDLRQRLYFRFFEPVDCSGVSPTDSEECQQIYDSVRNTVLNGMASLQRERAADPGRSLGARLRAIGARVLPAFDLMRESEAETK